MSFFSVALGGAIGAVGRYAISLIPVKTGFPVQTLITNILGAVLIGFIVGLVSQREDISPNTVLFWKTGVCGGFTTFSTFSLEAFSLLENHQISAGILYIALSVVFCIAGILCGRRLAMLLAYPDTAFSHKARTLERQNTADQNQVCGVLFCREGDPDAPVLPVVIHRPAHRAAPGHSPVPVPWSRRHEGCLSAYP